jgi:hypothetical protein
MRRICTLVLLLFAIALTLPAQESLKFRVGGGFDDLSAEQQALVRDWFEECAKITHNTIDPKAGYGDLKLTSERGD